MSVTAIDSTSNVLQIASARRPRTTLFARDGRPNKPRGSRHADAARLFVRAGASRVPRRAPACACVLTSAAQYVRDSNHEHVGQNGRLFRS